MTFASENSNSSHRVSFVTQILAWTLGIIACIGGMLDLIADWDMHLATVQLVILATLPVLWMITRRRAPVASHLLISSPNDWPAFWLAISVAITSLGTSFAVGQSMVDFPPAYHDEYSYVFQAKTLLRGSLSFPSHATHPELFDQMHVLNEGRMASRYYPGAGLWIAPWVAIGHPYWGHWFASALAAVFVFWTGYELGRLRVAVISGFSFALSPGVALFSNLLLAHQPTLVGLTLFVWSFVKWQRTTSSRDLFLSSCGLSYAMLCRPATAAGFGFPFGVAFLWWLFLQRRDETSLSWRHRFRCLMAIGAPLVVGWTIMLIYHHDVTGSWSTSPYQLYTDLYTPRHVYGFDNVVRGQAKMGPKVLEAYDRWAKNLTLELALTNVRERWLTSWLWTCDIAVLVITSVIAIATLRRSNYRWLCIGLGILSLHAIHIPYWYPGIMGWHYVFETAPLWCLLIGYSTDILCREWQVSGRWLLPGWWLLFLAVSISGAFIPYSWPGDQTLSPPRIANAIGTIRYPRKQYAEFDRWLAAAVTDRPSIVLITIDPDDQHVDYVVNSPGLEDDILRARYRKGITDPAIVQSDFPDRHVYLCDPKKKTIEKLK